MIFPGKIAAQCAHAAVSAYQKCQKNKKFKPYCDLWEKRGQKKIALKVLHSTRFGCSFVSPLVPSGVLRDDIMFLPDSQIDENI